MYNSASEIIAIHKKNGGDIANFGAPSDYDHLYVITQGDLTLRVCCTRRQVPCRDSQEGVQQASKARRH